MYIYSYLVRVFDYGVQSIHSRREREREREGESATRNSRNKDKTTKINTLNANGYLNIAKENRPPDPRSKATQ